MHPKTDLTSPACWSEKQTEETLLAVKVFARKLNC